MRSAQGAGAGGEESGRPALPTSRVGVLLWPPTLMLAHSFLLSPSHCSSPNRLHSFPWSPASLWPHLWAQQLLYSTLLCLSVVCLRNSQGVSHFHLLPFTKRPGRELTKSFQVWGAMVGSSHSLTDEAVLFEESGEPSCPGHLQKPYSQGGSQIFLLRVKQSVLSFPCQPPQHFSPPSFPQMSQGSPNLGSLLNMATAEAEGGPAAESSPFLGKAVKALVQEKLAEPWKVYLRR